MTGPQTPGPAESPPAAGPGPRVPVPPRNDAGGTGDPANTDSRALAAQLASLEVVADELAKRLALRQRERDEARASLAAALATLTRIRSLHTRVPEGEISTEVPWCTCDEPYPCPTLRAALEPPGGGT